MFACQCSRYAILGIEQKILGRSERTSRRKNLKKLGDQRSLVGKLFSEPAKHIAHHAD